MTSTRDREDEQQRLAAEFGRADLDPATAARRVTQLRQLVEQTEAAANRERLSRYRAALTAAEAEHARLREDALAANAALVDFAKGQ